MIGKGLLVDDGERMVPEFHQDKAMYAEHMARYLFASRFVAGRVVLDVASGSGYGSDLLKRAEAAEVVGLDILPNAVAYARENYSAASPEFMVGDAQNLPFGNAAFDVVVSFETLEHVPDYNLFLAEVRRVLKNGGLLVLSTPNKAVYPPGNPFHVKEFHVAELETVLGSFFRNINLLPEANWLASGVMLANSGAGEFLKELEALNLGPVTIEEAEYVVALCSDGPFPVANLNLILAPLSEVAQLRSLASERDAARASEHQENLRLQHEMTVRAALLSELEREIDAIRSRPGFQALEGVRRVADRMAPHGSLRGRTLALFVRGSAYLLNLGLRAFLLRLFQPWKWLLRTYKPIG